MQGRSKFAWLRARIPDTCVKRRVALRNATRLLSSGFVRVDALCRVKWCTHISGKVVRSCNRKMCTRSTPSKYGNSHVQRGLHRHHKFRIRSRSQRSHWDGARVITSRQGTSTHNKVADSQKPNYHADTLSLWRRCVLAA